MSLTCTAPEELDEGAPDPPAPPATPGRRRRSWPGRLHTLSLAALGLPFAVMIAVSLTRPWWPWGDLALIELRTHDVGGPSNPLLGTYSRFGWNHPGPVGFWVLAVPYRLLGARPSGMLAGTALVHAAAVAGCLWLAYRRGGRVLVMVVALALAALIRGFGIDNLVVFWNPVLPLFATAFLILATWSVLEGDLVLVPVVVGVSCFAWQTHLGYLPVTVMLAALALTGAALNLVWPPGTPGSPPRRPPPCTVGLTALATAAVATVALAPPVVEQLTNEPGNISAILASFRDPDAGSMGVRRSLAMLAAHLAPAGVWVSGDQATPVLTVGGVAALAASAVTVVAAFVLARRARAMAAVRLLIVTGTSAAVAVVAVFRAVGDPHPYLFLWLLPVAALLWSAVAWALIEAARRAPWFTGSGLNAGSGIRRWAPAGVVAMAAVTAGLSLATVTGRPWQLPGEPVAAPIGVLGHAAVTAAAGQERVRLRASRGWCAGELTHGIAVQLVEHGTDVVVDDLLPIEYGRDRVRDDLLPVVELVCGPDAGERVRRSPVDPVATVGLLSAEELTEQRSLAEGFRVQLRAEGRADLLPAVDAQAIGTVADLAAAGHPFPADAVARYAGLMSRSRVSGAVFWQPDPGSPAGAS